MPALAARAIEAARAAGKRLATAESCTGGLIAASLTEVAGSSDVFDFGFVTYANEAKTALLDVKESQLAVFGAVSPQVAKAMAEGALDRAGADLAVAVTGIAGPGGGSPQKPVGLVYLALATRGLETEVRRLQLDGDRAAIRYETARLALEALEARLGQP